MTRRRRQRRASLKALSHRAAAYARMAGSTGTNYSYGRRVERYLAWAARVGASVRPASVEVLGAYLVHLEEQGVSESTVRGTLSALRAYYDAHEGLGNAAHDVRVSRVLRQVTRRVAAPVERAQPIRAAQLAALIAEAEEGPRQWDLAPDPARWARDKALLLLGWASALRRAELVALDWDDIHWLPSGDAGVDALEGMQCYIVRSKRDQFARGAWVGIPCGPHPRTCPVRALWQWQEWVGRVAGPVFVGMCGNSWSTARASTSWVYRTVRRYAEAMGWSGCSPHSLRAGWATDMLTLGVAPEVVQAHLRHRDRSQLRVYYRPDDLLDGALLEKAGL